MKIKFYIKLSMITLMSIISTSCSLEEDPKYNFNSETVFNDESTTEAVIMQNYGWLGHANLYGQFMHETTMANGEYWSKTDGDRFQRTISYDMYQEHPFLNNIWTGFYKVISESNYLLNGLENSNLTSAFKTRAIAHARFLRGFAYFKLANLFGKACLITEPLTTNNLHTPLSERAEIYNQALSDLIYASENLPEKETMSGLATKYTASAFIAKCYWLMACQSQANGNDATSLYNSAKSYGDQVISKYSLETNFANLWVNHINNSKESIFQINFALSTTAGINLRTTFYFGPAGSSLSLGQPSFGNIKFDRAFYDFHRGTYPDDPRMKSTYLTKWINPRNNSIQYAYPLFNVSGVQYDMYASAPRKAGNSAVNPDYDFSATSTLPVAVRNRFNTTTGADQNIHPLNNKMASPDAVNQYDPRNLILYRYADLLLIMADVENELGNNNQALNYLNQVLDRARNSSVGATYPAHIQSALSKDEMRDKIFFERMFEMAGEPELFEDIRRRGINYLRKVVELHNDSKNVQYKYNFQVTNNVGGAFRDYIINNGSVSEDFLKKNLLLPIPLGEINNNDNVKQEDQNFGY